MFLVFPRLFPCPSFFFPCVPPFVSIFLVLFHHLYGFLSFSHVFSHVFPSFLAVFLVFPTFFVCIESPFRFRAEAYELAVLNNRNRSHFEAIECLCLGLLRCNGYNGG